MKGLSVLLMIASMIVLLSIQDTESKKMTAQEMAKTVKNLRKVCSKKTDAPSELLDGQHRGEFPHDERLMCYLKCIMVSTKLMKDDAIMWNVFVKNSKLMLLDEYLPRVEHIVDVCKSRVTSTDGCEAAWQFGQCIYETDAEVILKYDYTGNDTLGAVKLHTLVIHGPLSNSLDENLQDGERVRRRSSRTYGRRTVRHRRSRRKEAAALCKNSRTKPQCRKV